MRPRRSTRAKRFTVEKYDFELGSDDEHGRVEEEVVPKDDDVRDSNFDAGSAREAGNSVDEHATEDERGEAVEDEDGVGENEIEEEADEEEDPNGLDLQSSAKKARAGRASSHKQRDSFKGVTTYLDIEPVPPEGQHKGYVGPYDRGMRGKALVRAWYGPRHHSISKAHQLLDRWRGWTVLPPKVPHDQHEPTDRAFWSTDVVERESRLAAEWWARVKPSVADRGASPAWAELAPEELPYYQMPRHSMPALMGPHDAQQEIVFEAGCCCPLSHNGLPFDLDEDDGEKVASGWALDVGGVVLGMDWVPNRHKNIRQLLAMAVVPHIDQDFYNFDEVSVNPDFQRHGIVQIWQFLGSEPGGGGIVRPSTSNARRLRTLCFENGRVTRVQWSPTCNHLAALCGDGSVCVVDVEGLEMGQEEGFYKVQRPLASLRLLNEYGVKATAMAWINCNRIAVGYSDGSIALWSIHPCRLLSRHPVHHNHIVGMASGHPTLPHLIASIPLGGTARLIDIRAPSFETTEVQKPLIHTQPGMLAWSDHLQGFVSTYPSASSLNTVLGFLHHEHFPVVRRILTGDSFINCLAVGRLHPFLLVGAADGSVWCLNAQTEVFSNRHEATDKVRVLQHEHRSPALFPPDTPASARGVARILHGFGIERNRSSKGEGKAGAAASTASSSAAKKSARLLRKPKDAADAAEEDDEVADLTDPSRAVLHEPLTRITAMEWNPNEDYGCWAAVALGSGLVRIMDLGLER